MEYGKRAKTIAPSCTVTTGIQLWDMASAIDLLEKMSQLYIVKKGDYGQRAMLETPLTDLG